MNCRQAKADIALWVGEDLHEPQRREELRRHLGLDQPVLIQYRNYLAGLLIGDLGQSLYEQESVARLILTRLPATLELTLAAMAVAVLLSLPLALLAAASTAALL